MSKEEKNKMKNKGLTSSQPTQCANPNLRAMLSELEMKKKANKEIANQNLKRMVDEEKMTRNEEYKSLCAKLEEAIKVEGKVNYTLGLQTLQNIHAKLNSPSSFSPSVIPTNDIDHFSLLTPDIVQYIFSFLGLFGDIIPSSVSKHFRSIYACQTINFLKIGYYVLLSQITVYKHTISQQFYLSSNILSLAFYCEMACLLPSDASIIVSLPLLKILATNKDPKALWCLAKIYPVVFHPQMQSDIHRHLVIAETHPKANIDVFFQENLDNSTVYELMACIVGELIGRNQFPPSHIENAVTKFYKTMQEHQHPIASIPCRLHNIESGIKLGEVSNYVFPLKKLPSDNLEKAFIKSRPHFPVTDITTFDELLAMRGTMEDFLVFECRILQIDPQSPPLSASDIFAVMFDAKLDCMKGLTKSTDFDKHIHSLISPNNCFLSLFRSAANRGVYTSPWLMSYARLAAWKALAAIVGVPFSEGIEAIEEEAQECTYLNFRGLSGWWESGIGTGLGVLRKDGRTVVVFALSPPAL